MQNIIENLVQYFVGTNSLEYNNLGHLGSRFGLLLGSAYLISPYWTRHQPTTDMAFCAYIYEIPVYVFILYIEYIYIV